MRNVARGAAIALVATLLVLLVVHVATARRGAALVAAVAAGKHPAAPDFELARLDAHGKLRLSSLRGRVVVLNFWASWCRPCKEEAPTLAAAAARWRSRGVVFVGVDTQDFKGDARSFARRFGLAYANVHDGPGSVMTRYGVTGFPETWTVTRGGRIADHIAGVADRDRLDRAIRRALRG
jgi:cytochrome c biogenesis protein CcmG/thiol:disulfide interchange protein DsbE